MNSRDPEPHGTMVRPRFRSMKKYTGSSALHIVYTKKQFDPEDPDPSSLVAAKKFPDFVRALKKGLFS